jgi:23S rRNA (cytidine1920-2'-O)/16S rRNA (cytidine1409-2'-O)-methyltransferase
LDSKKKHRLDQVLVEKKLAKSRQRAQAIIMAGAVLVNDQPVLKAGKLISPEDKIELRGREMPFVSRGGLKLDGVLDTLQVDVTHKICLDVGASTGGFTDCLLQRGAELIYAVDVGYGQLAWKLRQDPRVVVIERTNIRKMPADALPHPVDLVTIDVSFISLKIVVPDVVKYVKKDARILALIKPQFEVGKNQVGKGGVVRDPVMHHQVIEQLTEFFAGIGLQSEAVVPSALIGPKGNREFFIYLNFDTKFRSNKA